ncbi:MAG: sulfite exporter TauE/SafE family protein [Planctomycetota bacterium]
MVFPVAGVEIHPVVPALLGLTIGVLSGLFGIGGGFLVTPALVWAGVPPPVAVGTCLNQMIATSSSGALLNARLGNVQARMGAFVAAGGAAAGVAGTLLVKRLLQDGAFGSSLGVAYVFILLAVGGGMVRESRRALKRERGGETAGEGTFDPSPRAYAAAFGLGLGVGAMSSFLGGGGGIVLVPALIYGLRVPTRIAVGTCLFSLLCVSSANTVFHASVNGSVDVVLAALLMLGSVPGSCVGVWLGRKVKPRALRGLFGGVLLLAGGKMLWDVLGGRLASDAAGVRVEGTAFGAVGAFAIEHGVLYGIAAAAFAVVVGGTVGTLLRKRVCGVPRPASAEAAAPCTPQPAAPDASPEAAER